MAKAKDIKTEIEVKEEVVVEMTKVSDIKKEVVMHTDPEMDAYLKRIFNK